MSVPTEERIDERNTAQAPIYAFLQMLRRHAWVVILCVAVVPLIAYMVTSRQDKEYEAAAKLLLGSDSVTERALRDQGVEAPPDQGVAATSLDLASLSRIAVGTARSLGGVTASEVSSSVTVVPRGSSSVVDITARNGRRDQVAPLANTYAESYIDFRRDDARKELRRVEDALTEQIGKAVRADQDARANDLRVRRDGVQLRARLQTGDAELVERAVTPDGPASPKPKLAAFLGAGFGTVLGVGLALLFQLLSRRLTDPKEAESLFDSAVLGMIPSSRAVHDASASSPFLPVVEQAAFQRVRSNLIHYNDYDISSIMVVSALPEEGKSTVAWNLALAAAQAGSNVVLVECDLRRPSMVRHFGLTPGAGVTAVLEGRARPEDVIERVPIDIEAVAGGDLRSLSVIAAGEAVANPTYLIESERMERLVLDLEDAFDLVVIDSPPALVVPDSMALVDYVSGVVVVTRMGTNTRETASNLRRQLENARAPVLGVVINGVEGLDGNSYGYAYEQAGVAGR